MLASVKLPKKVAIHNARLAFFHYLIYGCTLVLLVWYKFIIGNEAFLPIPIYVHTRIRWEESESIHAMENFFAHYPLLEQVCHQAPYTNFSGRERWGFVWPRRVACTNMCLLSSVIDHSTWDSVWKAPTLAANDTISTCWADFRDVGRTQRYTALQFLQSYGEQDVILTTSKNDWIVDHHLRTHLNKVEVVPQAKAAVLRADYRYAFLSEPGWFPFVQQNLPRNLNGSNANAQTVILDSHKKVVRVVEPGGDIKFTVNEVVFWSNESIPPGVLSDQLGRGAEFNLEMSCFGSQFDIEKHFGGGMIPNYHPTLETPVCTLEVTMVSPYYQVGVHYVVPQEAENSSVEIVSETKGFYFKCIAGHGAASAWDGNVLLISLSSMFVFLALPKKFTSIVASWMLGSLSEMYRRAIVEPYDIERAAAAAATVIAANVSAFHTLHQPSNKSGTGVSATEESADLTAIEIQKLLAEAMEHRRSELDDREVAALACFIFEGIKRRRKRSNTGLGAAVGDFLGFDFDLTSMRKSESGDRHQGITLDQWNQVRMDGEKITFDAVVKLFDKDRRRHFVESFFTPRHIKDALARAGDASAFIPEVSNNLELVHEHISWYQSNTDDFATGSALRAEIHASPQNASVAKFEADSLDIEPVCDPMDVEVPLCDELRREMGIISARFREAEEKLLARGEGPSSVGTEDISMGKPVVRGTVGPTRSPCATPTLTDETRREPLESRGAISRSASVSSEHDLSKTRGASSRCEHVPTPASRASSNDSLDDVEVSACPLHDTEESAHPLREARGSAGIGYPGSGAELREALPAPHPDVRNSSAAAEQRPSLPKVGGDWPVEMAGALRQAPRFADEYPGVPKAALRDASAPAVRASSQWPAPYAAAAASALRSFSEASALRGSSGTAPRTRESRRGPGAEGERSSCTAAAGGAGCLASGACSRAGRAGSAELQHDGAATVSPSRAAEHANARMLELIDMAKQEMAPSRAAEHAMARLIELTDMAQEQGDIRTAQEIRDHARVVQGLLSAGTGG